MLVNSGQSVSTPDTITSLASSVEVEIRKIDMGRGRGPDGFGWPYEDLEDCPPYRVGTYGILISSFNLVALNFFLENKNRRILNSLILSVTAQHINSLPILIRLVSSKRQITDENVFCIKETISLPGLSTFNNDLTCMLNMVGYHCSSAFQNLHYAVAMTSRFWC